MDPSCGRIIGPSEFIPVAEEAGLIVPIGSWAIQEACAAIRSFNQEFCRTFFMAVNLSPIQLRQPDLQGEIARNLEKNQLQPDSLEIELTEGVLMESSHHVREQLQGLRRLGVRITIDDFGTGFSNISYLWHFPVDRLKLDRSITSSLSTHSGSVIVAKAIITLVHQLNISVVAEGVETSSQADILRQADCDFAQGYLFSKPLPASSMSDRLRLHR